MSAVVESAAVEPTVEEDELPQVEDVDRREDAIRRDGTTQGEYYSKWDKFAATSEHTLDEEEAKETQEADELLGKNKYARSEAEKKDKETHKALKEAKKLWDQKRDLDEGAKHDVTESDVVRALDQAEFAGKRVLRFKDCHGATFELPEALDGMIKIFVEGCTDCTFAVRCKLVTSYVELSHCTRVTCNLEANVVHTVQVDLSETVTLRYGDRLLVEGVQRVYHAGVKDLNVFGTSPAGTHLSAHADFERDTAGEALPAEQHFITQVVEGELLTERAIRIGNRWATQRELNMETDAAAAVTQREREEIAMEAERSKAMGNQAFKNAEYAQAAVHYTMAIDQAGTAGAGLSGQAAAAAVDAATADAQPRPCLVAEGLVHVCYSNRAACWLKLGQHEKALEDADSCIRCNPSFVKGHFRKGLALHALKRYPEALPCLGRALELEDTKNKVSCKQIKDAIRFAEAKFAAARAGRT